MSYTVYIQIYLQRLNSAAVYTRWIPCNYGVRSSLIGSSIMQRPKWLKREIFCPNFKVNKFWFAHQKRSMGPLMSLIPGWCYFYTISFYSPLRYASIGSIYFQCTLIFQFQNRRKQLQCLSLEEATVYIMRFINVISMAKWTTFPGIITHCAGVWKGNLIKTISRNRLACVPKITLWLCFCSIG